LKETINGEAVKEAEANDPKKLRERIEQLEDQLRDEVGNGPGHDMEQERRLIEERDQARDELADMRRHADELQRQRDVIVQHFAGLSPLIHGVMADCESKLLEVVQLPTDEVDTSAAIPETKSRVPEAPRPIRETPRPIPDTPREGRDHRDVVHSGGGVVEPAEAHLGRDGRGVADGVLDYVDGGKVGEEWLPEGMMPASYYEDPRRGDIRTRDSLWRSALSAKQEEIEQLRGAIRYGKGLGAEHLAEIEWLRKELVQMNGRLETAFASGVVEGRASAGNGN